MLFHRKCTGLWSLGVVHIAAASLTSFGLFPSVAGVFLGLAVNSLCDCAARTFNLKTCSMSSWWDQLGDLCWVSLSAVVLSNFMDYFDELHHRGYLHLVPASVVPKLMPVIIIVVISFLFAVGLEGSRFLDKISSSLLSLSFGFHAACSLTVIRLDYAPLYFTKDTLIKIFSSTAVWLPFTSFNYEDETYTRIALPHSLYTLSLIILSSLSGIKFNEETGAVAPSFLDPLGSIYSWYRLIQVPVISCCFGMALYQRFIPALDSVAHKSFIRGLAKESLITGTKLRAVALVVDNRSDKGGEVLFPFCSFDKHLICGFDDEHKNLALERFDSDDKMSIDGKLTRDNPL